MASKNDSATKQLMAIYKLEFYKRKNNWKLYEDKVAKEPPESPETTKKLNETYKVGEEVPELDGEQVSPHNKAFLNEEPEDSPEPPEDIPDPLQPDVVGPASPPTHSPSPPHSWSGQLYSGDTTDPQTQWQDAQRLQEWCAAEPEVILEEIPEELPYGQCDGGFNQHKLWAPASDLSLKPAADPLDHPKNLTNGEMLCSAEDFLFRHGYPRLQDEIRGTPFISYDAHGLTDESEDFIRGAHEAPHSSEIELNITAECPCTVGEQLCALTVRELARAIQRHHYALARLLWEQAIRDALTAGTRPQPPLPIEECPTRDTDPLRAPDGFLSGSHRIVSDPCSGVSGPCSGVSGPFSGVSGPCSGVSGPFSGVSGPCSGVSGPQSLGRGRGRLHQARQQVGVAMGRPYLI